MLAGMKLGTVVIPASNLLTPVNLQIVEIEAFLGADFEEIAETIGGDEAGFDAAILDQRVGDDRGAVAEIGGTARLGGNVEEPFGDALGDALRRVVRGGGDFRNFDASSCVVE